MAAKLIRAKEFALEIDPDYYRTLWVNSHEACPDWMPPPDDAAADSYLGNGYFPSWCADVVHRQLTQAARDPRYAYGETILTVWPPPDNFAGLNAITRVIHCDDDGDGRADRTVTIPMPIFHALGMLSDMGDRYWVLPERVAAGNVTSGFVSSDDSGVIRILLYAHHAQDTQSRSDASFDMTLDLDGLGWAGPAHVEEYRFDRDHNSPFRLARSILDRSATAGGSDAARLAEVKKELESNDPPTQRRALETLRKLDTPTRQEALEVVFKLAGQAKDKGVRNAAAGIIRSDFGPAAYSAARSSRSKQSRNVIRPARRHILAKPMAICGSPSALRPTAATSWSSSGTRPNPGSGTRALNAARRDNPGIFRRGDYLEYPDHSWKWSIMVVIALVAMAMGHQGGGPSAGSLRGSLEGCCQPRWSPS